MPSDARGTLAEQQATLVRALAGLEPYPEGFDAGQLASTSSALAQKRSRAAAKSWPEFSNALGIDFESLFAEYAALNPSPPVRGAAVDGFQFAEFLAIRDRLPAEARRVWLTMRLHYRCSETQLRRRRGLIVVWDRRPGTWQIRVRAAWLM